MAKHLRFSMIALWVANIFCKLVNWLFFFFKECIHLYFLSLFFLKRYAFSFCFDTLVSSLHLRFCLAFYFQGNILLWFVFNIETMNQATPARKLEEVLHLAELCIEVLQQNEEHHAEVMTCFNCHRCTQCFAIVGTTLKKWSAHSLWYTSGHLSIEHWEPVHFLEL